MHKMSIQGIKNKVKPFREQVQIRDQWLEERFATVLPEIMNREDIDMWIVMAKEYNEDPVMMSMLPASMCSARRRTILVFVKNENGKVEALSLSRPQTGLEKLYQEVWVNPKGQNWTNDLSQDNEKGTPETQLECLNRIVKTYNPNKIGVNVSDTFAFADGLTKSHYDLLVETLDSDFVKRIVSAENLCVGWLEHRTDSEIAAYTGIVEIAHAIIETAFSSDVVLPGVTTNEDVKYFMIQTVIDLGLRHWFDFEVSVYRKGEGHRYDEVILQPGDILHCDVGLTYLGLCTDTQHNAYILKIDEIEVPKGIDQLQKDLNQLQDIVISHFKEGRTGNEILKLSREESIEKGLVPCIYTHPIGFHGHGAGTTIGLWDMQEGVPGNGDYPMHNRTLHSLELNITGKVPEWDDEEICIGAETDILFYRNNVFYVHSRQEKMHVIK